MNIFVLDFNPIVAARQLCDKHVVKMIVESAQMLSTAHHELQSKVVKEVYKPTHRNHPCSKWVRESSANYVWLLIHLHEMLDEYTRRYGRVHKTSRLLPYLSIVPHSEKGSLTPFAQAMPDEYKCKDPVKAYRKYYIAEKKSFATWKISSPPAWFK